jgi:cytochrome c oxidase assembly factor CtaG
VLTVPAVVWGLHSAVLWIWHLPKPYQTALENEMLHVVEHASFVVVAILFWGLVLGRHSRLSYGARIPLVFTTALQSAALGAILTFASTPLYPAHGDGPESWDLSPLADQQLAGAIMWIPMGAVYLVTMGVLFLRWFAPVAPMERRG